MQNVIMVVSIGVVQEGEAFIPCVEITSQGEIPREFVFPASGRWIDAYSKSVEMAETIVSEIRSVAEEVKK